MKPKILSLLVCFFLFYLFDHFSGIIKSIELWNSFNGKFIEIFDVFLNRSFLVFTFDALFTYLIFYKLYPLKGTIITILVYLFLAVPFMIGFRFFIEEVVFFALTGHHNYNLKYVTLKSYLLDNIYFTIYFNIVAIVFYGVQYERFSKMKKQALELQVRNAELSFLKSQINPHFLFNNLNNIYTLIYQKSENALPAIGKLSELLRYMLYQKADLVLLSLEIKYLQNFIDLQLMRYDFSPQLNINIQQKMDESISIIPLSLIPFIENAFKHGDLKDPDHPMCVDLEVQQNWLILKVKNKKNKLNRDETGGIGLENVRKRLELLKPNDFHLNITELDELFSVELKMKVNE